MENSKDTLLKVKLSFKTGYLYYCTSLVVTYYFTNKNRALDSDSPRVTEIVTGHTGSSLVVLHKTWTTLRKKGKYPGLRIHTHEIQ